VGVSDTQITLNIIYWSHLPFVLMKIITIGKKDSDFNLNDLIYM